MKHTPTPWEILDPTGTPFESNARKIVSPGKYGGIISDVSTHWYDPETAKANAAFIVRACNAYEKDQETIRELVAALRMYYLLDPRCHHGVTCCGECAACLASAALAKADQ